MAKKNDTAKEQRLRYRSALEKIKPELAVDPTKMLYLKYIAAITGSSVESLYDGILEDWLECSYPAYADNIEPKRRALLPTTAAPEDGPEAVHIAFDNMLKNLETMESRRTI